MSRRSDRLFRIVNFLQSRRRAVTAERMSEEFSVSTRTIYRDVQDLMSSGVPISGEVGIGYILDRKFTLPPLQFDEDEIETLVLGLSMVCSWTDQETSTAARQVIGKLNAVIGEHQRLALQSAALLAPPSTNKIPWKVDFSAIRIAIRKRQNLFFTYCDENKCTSDRTVRPLALVFFGPVWLLLGWCELRNDFRNFRLDRMRQFYVLDSTFRDEPGKRLHDFLKQMAYKDNLRG